MSIATAITALQGDVSAARSAITAKGGTVTSGGGSSQLATDIGTIPSGVTPTGNINITSTAQVDVTNYATAQVVDANLVAGNIKKDVNVLGVTGSYEGNNWLNYSTSYAFTNLKLPTDSIELTLVNITVLPQRGFAYTEGQSGPLDVTFHCSKPLTSLRVAFNQFFYGRNIVIDADLSAVTSYLSAFNTCFSNPNIVNGSIEPALDFSSATDVGYMFNSATYLASVKFVENTLKLSIALAQSSLLSDNSIVSIANGLNESTTGQTLTLHATPKARCSTLVGTVALDSTGTYHIFTQDSSGTTTLSDFITNTKGWTLA